MILLKQGSSKANQIQNTQYEDSCINNKGRKTIVFHSKNRDFKIDNKDKQ